MRRGEFFLSIINADEHQKTIWDPFSYRKAEGEILGEYITTSLLPRTTLSSVGKNFEPLEYSDISQGNNPTFLIKTAQDTPSGRWCYANDEFLLFGTMRPYLGNIVVIPSAEWLGLKMPLILPVKSEFLKVLPKDNLVYFWWALFKSANFLAKLPQGSGGTRPRLSEDALLRMPVKLPHIDERQRIDKIIRYEAQMMWQSYNQIGNAIKHAF